MYEVEEAFAYVVLLREWELMLFFELACFAYLIDSFQLKGWKSDDNSLGLHRSKPLKVDVANPLVPQLDVRLDFETFGINC